MPTARFMGPYHATDVESFLRCPYSFRLSRVEDKPQSHRHAKAILGDAVHFILEAYHEKKIPPEHQELQDFDVALNLLTGVFENLVVNGNPRYPERANLPVHYGRKRTGGTSQDVNPLEWRQEWLPKGTQMITGYLEQEYNQDIPGRVETRFVELGYELVLTASKKKKSSGYTMLGRMDQVREHFTLETLPASLGDFDRAYPGSLDRLKAIIRERPILELSDWKTTKDAPIYRNQRNPFVVLQKLYQLRIYALALREGSHGILHRQYSNETQQIVEWLEETGGPARAPDIVTFHWLPGYLRREKGNRTPEWAGRRAKVGESVQYLPGQAPGDPKEADPRFSIVIQDIDLETARKDTVTAMSQMRMGIWPRVPGAMTCTACRVVRECEMDMDKPILRDDDFADLDLEDVDFD